MLARRNQLPHLELLEHRDSSRGYSPFLELLQELVLLELEMATRWTRTSTTSAWRALIAAARAVSKLSRFELTSICSKRS